MSKLTGFVADDEALIRWVLQDALEDGGFATREAESGDEALALLDRHHSETSALVTDIRMGAGANGWDVAQHGRRLNPSLPVVYITGDSGAGWAQNAVANSILLNKPFTAIQILSSVQDLLRDQRRSAN
jgi:DNA-binding NtrC family response regulator